MTDITELAQRMKAAAEKATPGEWWADEVKNEGCYGSGDDCVEGFTSYAIYGSDGQTLFDSLNSDAACICEECDGEGHVAWDETAQRNAEFIALANPANVLALVEALEKAQQRIVELDRKNCELNSLTQRWAVERAENVDRIAELEYRAVTFKLPSTPEPSVFAPWVAKAFYQFRKDTVKSCVAVFSDACRAAGIKVEDEFKARSDDRMMYPPTCCHKHPETALQVHPLEQLMSYPPQSKMYCPECEPGVAEWAELDKQFRQGRR